MIIQENTFQCSKFMLSFKKRAQQCLPRFLWHRLHFGTCESLGSSLVKISQTFHDPSICFKLSYFHRKVNMLKTSEVCLYLDSDVSAGCFAIIFVGSFTLVKCAFISTQMFEADVPIIFVGYFPLSRGFCCFRSILC